MCFSAQVITQGVVAVSHPVRSVGRETARALVGTPSCFGGHNTLHGHECTVQNGSKNVESITDKAFLSLWTHPSGFFPVTITLGGGVQATKKGWY